MCRFSLCKNEMTGYTVCTRSLHQLSEGKQIAVASPEPFAGVFSPLPFSAFFAVKMMNVNTIFIEKDKL